MPLVINELNHQQKELFIVNLVKKIFILHVQESVKKHQIKQYNNGFVVIVLKQTMMKMEMTKKKKYLMKRKAKTMSLKITIEIEIIKKKLNKIN